MQRRIDARNKTAVDQSQPTVPTDAVEQAAADAQAQPNGDQPPAGYKYGSTMDSSTGKPELIKIEPTTTETTTPKETTPPVSETPPVEPKKTEETVPPVKTPEEQATFDAQQKKQEEDRIKAEADKAALAAKEAEAANK